MVLDPIPVWTPPPEVIERLEKGEAYAEVSTSRLTVSGQVRGAIDISAPPQIVWSLIRDCQKAKRMMPSVESCEVTNQDPKGHWDIREHKVKISGLLPYFTTRFRSTYEAQGRIRFDCVGGALRACRGEWRLVPLDDGSRTRVVYVNLAQGPSLAPVGLFSAFLEHQLPLALTGLRRQSESQMRDTSPTR
jgi:carbon monoxide dehydrogenase subunit G